jgi:hypothetical protein
MTVERLRSVVEAEPFVPFTLRPPTGARSRCRSRTWPPSSAPGARCSAHPKADRFELIDALPVNSVELGRDSGTRRRKAG